MAGNPSINLRLAVTGAEESLRTIATFGEAGQAAIQRLSEKFGAAGGAIDALGQRLTARQREIQALGQALDQIDRDRGGRGSISGEGRDTNAEAQAYAQAERAKQEALRQTAAAETEAAVAAEQASARATAARNQQVEAIRRYAAQVNAQYADPGEALANARSQINAAMAAGFLSEETAARALNAAIQQTGEAERRLGLDSQGAAEARAALITMAERENAEYDRLAAAVTRYRESLDPSIALERQRADVSAAVGAGLLREAEAYQQLTAAALRAAGAELRPGQALPGVVQQFASAGGAGLGAEAVAAARELAAANEAAARAMADVQAQAEAENAALDRQTAAMRAATESARAEYDALAASAARYRETLDPTIALERLRAETADQVSARLLTQAEAYQRLSAAALKAAGAELQPGQALPGAVQQFASAGGAGLAGPAVAQARELATANEAAARSMADVQTQAEAENLAFDRQTAAMRTATESARAEYDALAASAARYRESLDPTIALERLRTETSDQVSARLLTQSEAYERLSAAALKAGGAELRLGQPLPGAVQQFATVGATGGSAQAAVASAQALAGADQAVATQNRIIAETAKEVDAALAQQKVRADQLRASLDPLIAVQKLQAETDLLVANNALTAAEQTTLLANATARAAAQQRAAGLGAGQGFFGSARSYQVAIAASQLQDLTVQLQNGTSFFTAFAEQAPQLGYAFGSIGIIIGTVVGVATALVGVIFHLSESHDTAAKAAETQKKATDGLLQSFRVSVKDVTEFADGLDRLTATQKDLVGANLAVEFDKQGESFKTAQAELAKMIASAPQPGFMTKLLAGLAGEQGASGDELLKPEKGSTTEIFGADLQKQFDAFKAGAANIDAMRISFELLKESQGYTVDEAQKLSGQFVVQATVARQDEEAHKLLIAQYAVFNQRASDEQIALVNTTEAMKGAAAGAKAYAETLADLRERQRVAAMAPEDAKAYDLQKKGGLLDLQKAVDVEQDPDKKAALQFDMEERRTELAVEAKATAQAEDLAQSRKKLADLTEDLRAKEAGLAQGLDKEAAARAKVEGETRRALTVNGQLAEGGDAAIKRAGDEAAAEVRRQETQAASAKTRAAASRQDEFARKTRDDLAASEKGLAEAQRDGGAAAGDAAAHQQAYQQVIAAGFSTSDRRFANLVRDREQLILNQKAMEEAGKQAAALQRVSDELTQARAVASLPAEDVAASRDQKEALEAQVEAVKAGFKVGTDQFNQYVAQREEILHINDALKAQNDIAQIRAGLQEKIEQGEYYGYTSEGRPILRDGEDFKTERTITVNDDRLNGGRFTNIPTIYNGQQFDDRGATDMAAKFAAFGTAYKSFDTLNEALATAKERTASLTPEVEDLVEAYKRQAFIEQNVNDKLKGMTEADLAAKGGIDVVTAALDKEAAAAYEVAAARTARKNIALLDRKDEADLQHQTDLLEALGQSLQAYYDKKALFEAQDELRNQGITPARVGQDQYDEALNKDQAERVAKQQVDAELQAQKDAQQQMAEIVAQPFKDAASLITKTFADALGQVETDFSHLGDSLTGLAAGFRNIGNQFASALITAPMNQALAEFQKNLSDPNGGGLAGAFGKLQKEHPQLTGLMEGGIIGGVGGSIGAQISGNPNTATGGTFGGLAGGLAGSFFGPAGSLIGAALGTALGSFVGGFFGGGNTGKNNDAQGFRYDPLTGSYTKTDKQGSSQNAQAARGLTEQAVSALDILRAAGLGGQSAAFQFKVGNVSGTEYNGKSYASNQDAMKAAIRDLIDNSVGTISDTLKTVLKNTKAENAQQLQQDIAFAGQYDQLTGKVGAYGQALADLDTQYRSAENEAKKLGLSTVALASALADAEKDLKDKFTQQIKVLVGDSGPAGQAIFNLRQQFKDAAKDAAALGYTTQQMADAQAKQEAKLREQFHFQAESLIGAFGPLGQTILRIRDNFDQARRIFLDLGESVQGLAEKQAEAERKAYLAAEEQLQQQLSSQSQSIRSFLDGLVNPLKQALSGLGPLAGYISPQQGIASGLAQFRDTFRLAGNDNVQAIQSLPQEAQQLLQLARQNLGSGPEFARIFQEVQRDLRATLNAQQGRAGQVEANLPSSEQTAQQQLDALQSGFQDTVDALKQLHDDWQALNPNLVLLAGGAASLSRVAVDPAQMAAAFAPQLAAQQQSNQLIAGVSDAVRLGTAAQTDAIGRMTSTLANRLDRLESKIGLLQSGRLGRAA